MSDLLLQVENYINRPSVLKETASKFDHHHRISMDYWGFGMWKKADIGYINPTKVIDENEKLLSELYNDLINDKTTTPRPSKFECLENVVLLQGFQQEIDRNIGVVSTTLDYSSIGTSGAAESESQTDLTAEDTGGSYVRKQFSVSGSRARVGQTMKLGMLWDEGDVSAVPIIIRESGVHWHVSTASTCHARVVSTPFTLDTGDLFVIQVNELHENGTL